MFCTPHRARGASTRARTLATVFALSIQLLLARHATSVEAQVQPLPPGKTYVSLGDSYASGPGIAPYRDPGCQRSEYNWPSRLAWRMSLWPERTGPWADYSCFGASITGSTAPGGFANSLEDQIDWAASAANEAQRTLGATTTRVTISIGGNEAWGNQPGKSLYEALSSCKSPGNCNTADRLQPGSITRDEVINRLEPQLLRIRQLAPYATIELVGYPLVVPETTVQNCAGYWGPLQTWSFSPEDQTFLRQLALALRNAQAEAIAELNTRAPMGNKLKFVDLRPVSVGHDICRGGNAWIAAPFSSTPQELHPSQSGMDAFGDAIFAQ